jgi:hypothetical protein
MAFTLTRLAKIRSDQVGVSPQLVLEIDGIDKRFGIGTIKKYIKIGDDNLFIDGSWVIGGFNELENQIDAISLDGTSSSISQQLLQDKGGTSSVTSIQISLIDENDQITKLISPVIGGLTDPLATKARVYLGFEGTAFPEDFIIIFQGIIDEITTGGKIVLNIAHPEQKKRQELFPKITSELTNPIDAVQTTITLNSTANMVLPSSDGVIESYIRIEDEIVKFTGISGNDLTGCVRGQFDTIAAPHDAGKETNTIYRIRGNAIDICLKLMLSGASSWGNVKVKNFVRTVGTNTVPNAIFFEDINVQAVYGVVSGDKITITGASQAANNITNATITQVVAIDGGSYIVVSSPLVEELNSSATASFFSQYNTLTTGLGMTGDEVDVPQFQYVKDFFSGSLPTFDYLAKDTLNMKDFIDTEILFPSACYTLPRKGRVSIGFSSPPISIDTIPVLDENNVTKPNNIKSRRSINKNFYNSVLYSYNEDFLEDKFLNGVLVVSGDSTQRIKVPGLKTLKIKARGLRPGIDASSIIRVNSRRLLDRYKYAAEAFEVSMFYGDGFNIEVGDVVLFGSPYLKIPDIKYGDRNFRPRLFEVVNKTLNIRSGEVTLSLLDTSFSLDGRYGIFSPASNIVSGSTDHVIITESFGIDFTQKEFDKWTNYVGQKVILHPDDWSEVHECKFIGFSDQNPYRMNLSGLTITPQPGWIVEIPNYIETGIRGDGDIYKQIHCFSGATVSIVSGISQTEFEVSAADISKFVVGSLVTVRNDDFTVLSEEVRIEHVDSLTNRIVVNRALGFIPLAGYSAETLNFRDNGFSYRYL